MDVSKGRVLHVAGSFFQRSETFLYNQISGLRGWRSSLACAELLNQADFPLPGVSAHLCRVVDNAWLRAYDRIARRCGLTGTGQRRFERGMQSGLRAALGAIEPQVVHAHFGINGVIAESVCRAAGVPLVTSFYGFDSAHPGTELSQGWFYAHYPQLFKSAELILVEGPAIARRLERDWGCPREKLRVVRIAIPARSILFQARKPLAGRAVQLLFCGRFVEKKGLLVLLSALAKFKEAGGRFTLRVIGDGPLRDAATNFIDKAGIREHVTLLGLQPRTRFWDELAKCDLLVAPSQTAQNGDTEGGAPTVLLEAQAAGVPVVATRHADIPFIVAPENTPFLAEENDPDSLAEVLLKACRQSTRWPEMGHAGRRFVTENHDSSVVCQQLSGLYDDVVKRPTKEG